MKTPYQVKIAQPDDIAGILSVAASASITPAWTEAFIRERLSREDTRILTASTGCGDIIGFAVFRTVGDDGELLQIAVCPEERQKGVGSLLLETVLRNAQEKVPGSVFLEVRAGNTAAIGLYKKYGFKEVRTRKDYYNDPVEDAVVMILPAP